MHFPSVWGTRECENLLETTQNLSDCSALGMGSFEAIDIIRTKMPYSPPIIRLKSTPSAFFLFSQFPVGQSENVRMISSPKDSVQDLTLGRESWALSG